MRDWIRSESDQAIADSVQQFARANYVFDARHFRGRPSREESLTHWREFSELGWLALPIDERHGGLGLGLREVAIVAGELGAALAREPWLESIVLAGRLLQHRSSTVPAKKLAELLSGESITVLAHTEGAVLDSAPTARAERTATGYRLRGAKSLVYHAPIADAFLVTARLTDTAPDTTSLFWVPADAPGLSCSAYRTLDAKSAGDLQLIDVVVGTDQLLVTSDNAQSALRSSLAYVAIAGCAESASIAQTLTATTARYLNERKQFGAPLASFQALQHRLADCFAHAEEATALVALAIDRYEANGNVVDVELATTVKSRVDKLCIEVGHAAIQLHGGMGFSDELAVSHYARRLQALSRCFAIPNKSASS